MEGNAVTVTFRDYQRVGVNPTLAWRPGETTTLTFGLEHFSDERTALLQERLCDLFIADVVDYAFLCRRKC